MQIFRSPYVVRRFGEQEIVQGHATSGYADEVTKLNVQPLNPNELQALPEGQRTVKRIKAFGDYPLRAADQDAGTPGDLLRYLGQWYECASSVLWNHTLLGHYRSEFTLLPEGEASKYPPPAGEVSP